MSDVQPDQLPFPDVGTEYLRGSMPADPDEAEVERQLWYLTFLPASPLHQNATEGNHR